MGRGAWGAAPALLVLLGCGEGTRTLVLPADKHGARSALLAISGALEPPRFYAFDLPQPGPVHARLTTPAQAALLFFAAPLAELSVEGGSLEGTPGGRPVPEALWAMEASILPDQEASWSIAQGRPPVFDALRLPRTGPSCRAVSSEQRSLEPINPFVQLYAGARSAEQVLIGGSDGRIYSIGAELEPRAVTPPSGLAPVAINGALLADGGGAVQRLTSPPGALALSAVPLAGAVPDGGVITRLEETSWGALAVLTSSRTLWLYQADRWRLLHRFPLYTSYRPGLLRDEERGTVLATQSPAGYLVEVGPDGVHTATVSATGLSVLAFAAPDGRRALYAGDDAGVIFVRDEHGAWARIVDTEIADPVLDLLSGKDRLIYVGSDGWSGSWVPGIGLCTHGPIISDASMAARLGTRGLYFRYGGFVATEAD